MLPLGPKPWQINSTFASLGMSIFFALSGFLITKTLIHNSNIYNFLIRRFCRILPLAWAFLLLALPLVAATPDAYMAHFLFYANLPPFWLTDLTAHFWSLCVEMQFYLYMALLIAALGQRGLKLLPVFCLVVTAGRIWQGETISIVTYYRVDEILAGGWLALAYERQSAENPLPRFLCWINSYLLLGLLLIACHPASGPVNYFRPYFAVALVGSTLYQGDAQPFSWLKTNILSYIGAISYALYVLHPLTYYGWLGSGDVIIKYAKRPFSILLSFGLAHLSTFYYEKFWISWGKRWTSSTSKLR